MIRLKLDSSEIAKMLTGAVVETSCYLGTEVRKISVIASDDGVEQYRERINNALDQVQDKLWKAHNDRQNKNKDG